MRINHRQKAVEPHRQKAVEPHRQEIVEGSAVFHRQRMVMYMTLDPVTGLDEGEEKEIKAKLMSFYAQNNITPIYQAGYWSFASTIKKSTTQEAQIALNKWNTRGLSKPFLLTIAKDICNKDLV